MNSSDNNQHNILDINEQYYFKGNLLIKLEQNYKKEINKEDKENILDQSNNKKIKSRLSKKNNS